MKEGKFVEENPDAYWFRTIRGKPNVEVGDRVYYVDQGAITGYGIVFEITHGELQCETTGKTYHGTHLKQRKWVDINSVPFKGFQGFRYISRIRGLEQKLMEAEIFIAYPLTKLEHDLWEHFPEWLFNLSSPNALREADEALTKVNDWHNSIIRDFVELYDFLEKERKESEGKIPVKACYVFQQKLVELVLGVDVDTARTFLIEVGLKKE